VDDAVKEIHSRNPVGGDAGNQKGEIHADNHEDRFAQMGTDPVRMTFGAVKHGGFFALKKDQHDQDEAEASAELHPAAVVEIDARNRFDVHDGQPGRCPGTDRLEYRLKRRQKIADHKGDG